MMTISLILCLMIATSKTRKIHDDYIFDFVFDDGHIKNIYLLDKKSIVRNKVRVIKHFEQTSSAANRYDMTMLVNRLLLVKNQLCNVIVNTIKPVMTTD